MDRRQKKTRDAIYSAFSTLLDKKRYGHITVQDIIDEANIGRSTFYSHFETKDMLLKEMCKDIFEHIFDGDICSFPSDDLTLESKLAHILWHLKFSKISIGGLLSSESSDLFLHYFKEELTKLFSMYRSEFKMDVPDDFLLNHLVGSFTVAVKWWVSCGMKEEPSRVAGYFMKVTEKHL